MISALRQHRHNVRRKSYLPKMIRSPKRLGLGFLLFLFSLGVFYTRAGTPTRVYAASSNLSFQARLLNSAGSIVPDGTYNIEFKLYDSLSAGGSLQGVCAGGVTDDCLWLETRTGGSKVTVRNGYMNVYLGSVTGFGNINWEQDLWLTMNIGGSGGPSWDGEMSPRIKLTAVPYAFNAGQLGGIASTGFAQLALSAVQGVNSGNTALRLNQIGAGGLVQLQGNGSDVFTIAKTGDLASAGSATLSGGTLNLGTASQSGGLVLYDGSSNTGTLQTAALGQNTAFTLPDPGGPSATICLSSGNCAGTGDIRNGGNSFGGLITIGTNDGNGLAFETAGTTKMTILPNGNVGVNVSSPTAVLAAQGIASTSGTTTMTAVTSTTTLTTSASTTLNEGDYIVPSASSGQARTIVTGGTGTVFTVTPAFSANVALEIFTIYRPITKLTTDGGTTALLAQGSTGRVGIGTNAPLALFSVGGSSQFQVSSAGGVTAVGIGSAGAVINLNNDSNFATSINTGSSNGTVTIGGGSAPLVIDSTNFDVSSGGGLSGITGYAQASGNFAISGTGSFSTGSGLVNLNGATSISTSANSTVALTINGTSGTAATALDVVQTGNAANLTLSNSARTSGALISLTHTTSAFTGTGLLMNLASGSGSFASGNFLDFQVNGTTKVKIDNTGALQINSDSAAALIVRNSAGTLSYFTVNTTGNIVQIGASGTGDTTAILFVLDTKNTTGDPTGTDGGSYYNSADAKFRCYENGTWSDCMSSRVLGETTLGAAGGTMTVNLASSVEYVHCRIDVKSRSAAAGVYMRFNGDTGVANYSWNEYDIIVATVGDAQDNSDSEIQLNGTDTGTAPASAEIRITNFADTRKVVDWSWATAEAIGTNTRRYSGSGTWANTSNQVTSVTFLTSTGNFGIGSHAWCEGRNVR